LLVKRTVLAGHIRWVGLLLAFLLPLFFELGNQAQGRCNVRVLLGVLHAQAVEVLVQGGDPAIEFGTVTRASDGGEHRLVAGKLRFDRLAGLLRLRQFQFGAGQGFARRGQLATVVLTFAGQQVVMLEAKVFDRVLGAQEALFIALDLFVDELHCFLRIAALALEAAFHEDGEQGLHHIAHLARIGVGVAEGIDIIGAGAGAVDLDAFQQLVHHIVALPRCHRAHVKVYHAQDAFDIGPAKQGAAHDRHLLFNIGHAGHAGHQWLEYALRVDEHTRRALILVGQRIDLGPARQHEQPADAKARPTVFPDAFQAGQQLAD
jgi:hypothetical protein